MMGRADLAGVAHQALAAALAGDAQGRARLDGLRGPLAALAEDGDADALSVLGGIALEYDRDPDTALRHWTRAADQGHPAGQRSLGHLYATGTGVAQDLERAAALFAPAAAAGDRYAMFNLALLYLRGELADRKEPGEVMALLESAADLGLVQARARLGDWLAELDRDEEALRAYLQAAESGYPAAMHTAACWYRDGDGTERDPVQAVRWFLAMLGAGSGDGVHEAIELARTMTDEEIRHAAMLAGRPDDAEALLSTVGR